MTFTLTDDPAWLQNVGYPARLDRLVLDALWTEGTITGLGVTQRAAGANLSVDVGAGYAAIVGDDQADQGTYLAHLSGTTNVEIAAPGAQPRVDLIVMRINDVQAGGPAGNNGQIVPLTGTPAASNPQPPALPATAVELARVNVAANATSIANAAIDQTQRARASVRANAGTLATRSSSLIRSQALTVQNTMHGAMPATIPGILAQQGSEPGGAAQMKALRPCLVSFDLSALRTGGAGSDWQARHVLPNGQIKIFTGSPSRAMLNTVLPMNTGDVFQMGYWVGTVGLTLQTQSYVTVIDVF